MTWFLGIVLSFVSILNVFGNEGDNLIRIEPITSITLTPEGFESTLAAVPWMISCGGPAEVIDWRYESCSQLSPNGNCQIPSDGKRKQCEFTFIPSEPIPGGLFLRLNASATDVPPRIYDLPLENSAVRGGQVYTVRSAGSPTKVFQGKTMTFQYIILRQADNSVEACAQTDYDNV